MGAISEEVVNRAVRQKIREIIYERFHLTPDAGNLIEYGLHVSSHFSSRVRLTSKWVTRIEEIGDGRKLVYWDFEFELSEYAKANLRILDIGLDGWIVPPGVTRRNVEHRAGYIHITDVIDYLNIRRSYDLSPWGEVSNWHVVDQTRGAKQILEYDETTKRYRIKR